LLPSKILENGTAKGSDKINVSIVPMPEAFIWNAINSAGLPQFQGTN
jgi:hypothetical protein